MGRELIDGFGVLRIEVPAQPSSISGRPVSKIGFRAISEHIGLRFMDLLQELIEMLL